jgi:hypothetical protein
VAARQNLRKTLKQNSSSQAGACRKFDRQQAQKLRRPPADESKKQLAALENDVRELARTEQKFSEQIEPDGSGGPQLQEAEQQRKQAQASTKPFAASASNGSKNGSLSSEKSNEAAQSEPSLAEQQKQAAREADRLAKLAKKDEALTESARKRLGQAAGSIEDSSQAMAETREADAAAKAREAARQLESLARQIGALKANELSDRLARERDFAQAIARAERELGRALKRRAESQSGTADANNPLADRQRELALDVAALADVLEQLKASARLEERELAQSIIQAEQSNAPGEIEQSMRQNVDAIRAGRRDQAAQAATALAERLEALAHDLESARRVAAGPQLERLLAAEKEAATLQERLRSVRKRSEQPGLERALAELADRADQLSPADGSLKQAAERLEGATRAGHSGSWSSNGQVKDGDASYFVPPMEYTESLAAVSAALQSKIQEMIVENSLVERNGAVPPEYKKLVEDYYRVLSQDLR